MLDGTFAVVLDQRKSSALAQHQYNIAVWAWDLLLNYSAFCRFTTRTCKSQVNSSICSYCWIDKKDQHHTCTFCVWASQAKLLPYSTRVLCLGKAFCSTPARPLEMQLTRPGVTFNGYELRSVPNLTASCGGLLAIFVPSLELQNLKIILLIVVCIKGIIVISHVLFCLGGKLALLSGAELTIIRRALSWWSIFAFNSFASFFNKSSSPKQCHLNLLSIEVNA